MQDLAGKVAVVTGGASGIGRALAEKFAAEGMKVVVADIEEPRLNEVVEAIRADGGEAIGVVVDVSSADSVAALHAAATAAFGPADVVCNNAGVGGGGAIAEASIQTWEWTLGVNLWGVIHGLRTFLPDMIEAGAGHIVNTASIAGHISSAGMGPYNATKFAVVTISETLHQEMLADETGVKVSCLCPGFVATNILTSERNRPERLMDAQGLLPSGDAPSALDDMGGLDAISEIYAAQLSPTVVADLVVDAIRAGDFWIFTDDKFEDAIRARHDHIQERRTPQANAHLGEKLFQ